MPTDSFIDLIVAYTTQKTSGQYKSKSKKGDRPLFSGIVPSGSGLVVKECDFYPFSFPDLLRIRPDPYSFKKGACPLFSFLFFWNICCSESSFLIKDEKTDVEFKI